MIPPHFMKNKVQFNQKVSALTLFICFQWIFYGRFLNDIEKEVPSPILDKLSKKLFIASYNFGKKHFLLILSKKCIIKNNCLNQKLGWVLLKVYNQASSVPKMKRIGWKMTELKLFSWNNFRLEKLASKDCNLCWIKCHFSWETCCIWKTNVDFVMILHI